MTTDLTIEQQRAIAIARARQAQAQQQAPVQRQAPGIGRTILDQLLQGGTFGFAEEITDPLGAVIATGVRDPRALLTGEVTDPALAQELSGARAGTQERLGRQFEERPGLSIASNILGGLGTGAAGLSTRGGAALTNLLGRSNLLGRTAISGGVGTTSAGIFGAGTAEEGQRLQGAQQAAAIGGPISAVIPGAGAAVGALRPNVTEVTGALAQRAREFDIPLSIDQITDSKFIKSFQKLSDKAPLAGVQKFRDQQLSQFNRALTRTFGQDADRITPELMDKAFKDTGKKFDALTKGKTFEVPQDTFDQIDELLNVAGREGGPGAVENLERTIELFLNALDDGVISGNKIAKVRSQINKATRNRNNPASEFAGDLENIVIDVITSADPAARAALRQAKLEYKNLIAVEPLAQKSKAGIIPVTQLSNRVARVYGRSFTRGQAGEIGDLARIGKELLPTLGGSDTAEKLAILKGAQVLGTGGALAADLGVTASLLGGNRAIQSGILRNPRVVERAISRSQQPSILRVPQQQGILGGPRQLQR